MSKVYTAQEMRDFAAVISRLHIVDRMTCGEYCNTAKNKIRDMLRQAADALDRDEKRDKKYEYSVKFVDGTISQMHEDERLSVSRGLKAVRRSVGEWEDVKDVS